LGPTDSTEREGHFRIDRLQRRLDREDDLDRDRLSWPSCAWMRIIATFWSARKVGSNTSEIDTSPRPSGCKRLAVGAHVHGLRGSVRIVVPPRKSIPKFSPMASQITDRTIATTEAPKVAFQRT
jgi:hypothetical protein